ncbi:hypothetical protein SAMN04244579_04957, partial [Azotobacter beijerinckii]
LHMIQTGRMGELVSSDYSPFNFNVDTGDAREHAGLDKPIAGADGLQQRFDSLRGAARGAYASEQDMASSGYRSTKESGRSIAEDSYTDSTAVVQDSAETHSGLVKAAPDQGLEAPETKLKSATPVTGTAKAIAQNGPFTSTRIGTAQIIENVAGIAGIDKDDSTLKEITDYVRSPVDSTVDGVKKAFNKLSDQADSWLSDDDPGDKKK